MQQESERESSSLEDVSEPLLLMLRELDAGRHCGCRFRAIRGLMTHLAHAHGDGARALLNLLSASNQSPWCRSIFANRETAIKHTSAAAGPPLKTSPLSLTCAV